ncbi:DUF6262 family protein [Kitasatospora sp. NPDC056531]|uniref:DUF6262 family protein n=1 Tax=Kitasatospora sp. NPDC056531 TaxID=3345856 RepID=UPI0036CE0CC2
MPAESPSRAPTDALRAARQRDSLTKRSRALGAVQDMLRAGEPVTFAAVAKRAGVSSWLVYAPGVREHIEKARRRQAADPARAENAGLSVSGSSARTDLLLAREEINRLRAEVSSLRGAMRVHLGQQLDQLAAHDLTARVAELTEENHRLAVAAREAEAENRHLKTQVTTLEDDLAAARTSLRRMIRSQN